ncbi:hypothetical protein F5Y12DRAFT_282350 [Xylaria sp. FL1777]|nr:hypothetical protein F5Y12DRAFT_282350 [Xylaria sp. FL1777]
MAPQPPTKHQKTRTESSKRPRRNRESTTKKKGPVKFARPSSPRKVTEEPIYSPNIRSSEVSELTEDDDEPRHVSYAHLHTAVEDAADEETGPGKGPSASISIISGKTPRQLRAERRAAERRNEDFTDDEKLVAKTKVVKPASRVYAKRAGVWLSEMDWDPTPDPDGEYDDDNRMIVVPPTQRSSSPMKIDPNPAFAGIAKEGQVDAHQAGRYLNPNDGVPKPTLQATLVVLVVLVIFLLSAFVSWAHRRPPFARATHHPLREIARAIGLRSRGLVSALRTGRPVRRVLR